MKRAFVFGLGFSGRVIARRLMRAGWRVAGTTRDAGRAARREAEHIEAHIFSGEAPMAGAAAALAGAGRIVVSIPPDAGGDPVLRHHGDDLAALAGERAGSGPAPFRIAYLSTTAVYGNHDGAWIDETTPPAPRSARARARVAAEAAWRAAAARMGAELDIYRLSGIYGPGRNQVRAVRAGTARRIVKPGQVFNRIHVDDIASAVLAGFERALPGAVYNLADDEPAPPQDVVAYAAGLCGLPPPEEEDFASAEMSEMARSFYSESKRIRNDLVKSRLGLALAYPTYREGLTALRDDGA